ncbi:hypothetical protein DLM75_07155 [Leptospira stimsonii]|uniref:Uncharacterized protein n=1 Tax=Leptospira stimsonii TaxID=2202203 RepID=A0A396ZF94_9LEPT|nr:hypothetical protein DLM75_07155 [Leptospira stimsonii]
MSADSNFIVLLEKKEFLLFKGSFACVGVKRFFSNDSYLSLKTRKKILLNPFKNGIEGEILCKRSQSDAFDSSFTLQIRGI